MKHRLITIQIDTHICYQLTCYPFAINKCSRILRGNYKARNCAQVKSTCVGNPNSN